MGKLFQMTIWDDYMGKLFQMTIWNDYMGWSLRMVIREAIWDGYPKWLLVMSMMALHHSYPEGISRLAIRDDVLFGRAT